jgi:hypothetical protein
MLDVIFNDKDNTVVVSKGDITHTYTQDKINYLMLENGCEDLMEMLFLAEPSIDRVYHVTGNGKLVWLN